VNEPTLKADGLGERHAFLLELLITNETQLTTREAFINHLGVIQGRNEEIKKRWEISQAEGNGHYISPEGMFSVHPDLDYLHERGYLHLDRERIILTEKTKQLPRYQTHKLL